MTRLVKLELVCELCGTQVKELEIHKMMLACSFCLHTYKIKERRKKEDAEWDRMEAEEKKKKSS